MGNSHGDSDFVLNTTEWWRCFARFSQIRKLHYTLPSNTDFQKFFCCSLDQTYDILLDIESLRKCETTHFVFFQNYFSIDLQFCWNKLISSFLHHCQHMLIFMFATIMSSTPTYNGNALDLFYQCLRIVNSIDPHCCYYFVGLVKVSSNAY